jgi:hypothetical protein
VDYPQHRAQLGPASAGLFLVSYAQQPEQIHPPVAKHNCGCALAWQAKELCLLCHSRALFSSACRTSWRVVSTAIKRIDERGILAMPKARAKSPARRQRRPSEWVVLSRYLRQMTGHDPDSYARLVAVLKDRFARLDAREVWDRLRFEEEAGNGSARLRSGRRV